MTTAEQTKELQQIFEMLMIASKLKAEMIAAGETVRTTPCPRCGFGLRFRLIGPRRHVRMSCAGFCGMSFME